MPYALLLIGAILLVAGVRNTYGQLWALIKNDFIGTGGFINWVAAIAVIGAIGYIPRLRSLSVAFMTLLLLVLVLSHAGLFAQLQNFIQNGLGASNTITGVVVNPSVSGGVQVPSTVLTPSVNPPQQYDPNAPGYSAVDLINQNLQSIGGL